ncbi:MAG: hypothetical protein QM779_11495 [Propionicimonas sp.]|uniref:hypothetical protein n=1 Tax=Propionicimonas sp. TaxID=1955623 RepID=UPI003D147A56
MLPAQPAAGDVTPAELVAPGIGQLDTHELDPHSGEVELFLDQLSKHGHIVTGGTDLPASLSATESGSRPEVS